MCTAFIVARAFIGTSGWNYKHWSKGVFYPTALKPRDWLKFYTQQFRTVEINNSFYRLPSEAVFERWRDQVPQGFIFAVKASRFLTHIKRLRDPADPLGVFFSRAKLLGNRLGPVLFQLPPQFKADIDRLGIFLEALNSNPVGRSTRSVLEVRDETWLQPHVLDLLRQHRVALCFADWRELHITQPTTADFVYLRRHHGPLNGNYGKRHLDRDVQLIRQWLEQGLDTYVYFNNDPHGHAVRNAKYIQEQLEALTAIPRLRRIS